MLLVKNLCCFLNCKAFGRSRVKTRWCLMYLQETWAIYLLVRPWVRRELWVEGSDSMMYHVPRGATCATYLLVGPWTRRELRLENDSCEELALFTWFQDLRWVEGYDSMMYHVSWGNMCYLLTCNALDETRVTTRKRFLGRTCVVYLIVRLSVGRGLSLDDVPCILRTLALFTYL